MREPEQLTAWHLDKRIPIALIVTLIVQTGLAVWWVSNLSHRVDTATATNIEQDLRIGAVEGVTRQQQVTAATIAEQISGMRESLAELKSEQAETNTLLRELLTNGKAKP
jgi:TolA-binding protein